ncbi:MAG: tyrosine-type recombinase/integrase [Chitinophagaceae bacterium]
MPSFTLSYLQHRSKEWIAIKAAPSESFNQVLRKLNAVFTKTHKCWLMPFTKESVDALKKTFGDIAIRQLEDLKKKVEQQKKQVLTITMVLPTPTTKNKTLQIYPLSPENTDAMKLYLQTLSLKCYSASTIRTYKYEFLQLLLVLKSKSVKELTPEQLKRYLQHCIEKGGLKENTMHSRINAIKFYFEQVLHKEQFFFEIPRPKKPWLLPRFFNQSEIASIIRAADNIKHRVLLMLAYSAGLRVSEVVAIKTRNVDSARMSILVERAKGKKDRLVALSPLLLIMLREYWKEYKPEKDGYLFEGQNEGQPYSTRSLQLILDRAKQRAGVIKKGSIHALRHSFATHLLDKGTDVTMIMKLLGHNDIKTTLRYLHVTNRDMLHVISPLDDLGLDFP